MLQITRFNIFDIKIKIVNFVLTFHAYIALVEDHGLEYSYDISIDDDDFVEETNILKCTESYQYWNDCSSSCYLTCSEPNLYYHQDGSLRICDTACHPRCECFLLDENNNLLVWDESLTNCIPISECVTSRKKEKDD